MGVLARECGDILVTFFIKDVPVRDAPIEQAYMDIVKVVGRVNPGAAAVVDFKMQVWRRMPVLDASKVGSLSMDEMNVRHGKSSARLTYYVCTSELVRKIPDTISLGSSCRKCYSVILCP